MITVHNPTSWSLFCAPLGRQIGADERIEITDEQAEMIEGGAVFVIARGKREPVAESAASRRETAKRGGRKAEVTAKPDLETR